MLKIQPSAYNYYLGITNQEADMLKVIQQRPGVSTNDISAQTEIGKTHLSKSLQQMHRAGLINRHQAGTYAQWFINPGSLAEDIILYAA